MLDRTLAIGAEYEPAKRNRKGIDKLVEGGLVVGIESIYYTTRLGAWKTGEHAQGQDRANGKPIVVTSFLNPPRNPG